VFSPQCFCFPWCLVPTTCPRTLCASPSRFNTPVKPSSEPRGLEALTIQGGFLRICFLGLHRQIAILLTVNFNSCQLVAHRDPWISTESLSSNHKSPSWTCPPPSVNDRSAICCQFCWTMPHCYFPLCTFLLPNGVHVLDTFLFLFCCFFVWCFFCFTPPPFPFMTCLFIN